MLCDGYQLECSEPAEHAAIERALVGAGQHIRTCAPQGPVQFYFQGTAIAQGSIRERLPDKQGVDHSGAQASSLTSRFLILSHSRMRVPSRYVLSRRSATMPSR